MKLSTAIRKGTERDGKQAFGSLFETDDEGNIVGCCALGAAVIGKVGIKKAEESEREGGVLSLRELFPRVDARVSLNGDEMDVSDAVIRLNDNRRWSRKRIATWLEKRGF